MIKTQKELRRIFWLTFPALSRKRITNYTGTGMIYTTDTRCTFNDWVDALGKNGEISDRLAQIATL